MLDLGEELRLTSQLEVLLRIENAILQERLELEQKLAKLKEQA